MLKNLVVGTLGVSVGAALSAIDSHSLVHTYAVMPAMRLLDAEDAHNLAIKLASMGLAPRDLLRSDAPNLRTKVLGMEFRNPVGLAAGFDKHADAMDGMLGMGFGFVEVGSVTPLPQAGNPKPRMFRLLEDRAVINRYGFNSEGADAAEKKLSQWSKQPSHKGPVGVNLGKNKEQTDAAADYVVGVQKLGPYADYIVVNVSSPNTPGLRSLQGREQLADIVTKVQKARDLLPGRPPLLIKIAPDLTEDDIVDIAHVAKSKKVDGLIVSNTTVDRPASLKSSAELTKQIGGLSGAPLFEKSTQVLAKIYKETNGEVPLIGVGGIKNGQDAYEKILHGASLVQVYSAMTYDGPPLVGRVKEELSRLLKRDGYASVADAVGKKVSL